MNTKNFEYFLVKLSNLDVYNLLHGNIPIRDIFLKQNEYWDIETNNNNIFNDIVDKKEISKLDSSLLPEENVCFKILTEQVKLFVEKYSLP